jgi:hypothetical protein
MPRLVAATAALFVAQDDHVLRSRVEARFLQVVDEVTHAGVELLACAYYSALYAHNLRKPARQRGGRPTPKRLAAQRVAETWVATSSSGPTLFAFDAVEAGRGERQQGGPSRGVGGRPPTDFVYLLRAFMGVATMGLEPEPGMVHTVLVSNPSFARICGFDYQIADAGRVIRDTVPSLRKLQEFDQVMSEAGLWGQLKTQYVAENISAGRVEVETDLTVDTTHYPACSGFDVREISAPTAKTKDTETATDLELEEDGKPAGVRRGKGRKKKRRAVPRVAKRCGCRERDRCTHEYAPTDEGAGVVVKGGASRKSVWAHKASIIAFANSEVPIDAVAVKYAGTHDGGTLVPHLDRLKLLHPEVLAAAKRVIADSAYQSAENQAAAAARSLKLVVPINPRAIKPKPADLPGISHYSPTGIPVCAAGHELRHRGRRLEERKHLWGPPRSDDGVVACGSCPLRETCCPGAQDGRTLTTNADDFPQIDWDLPQHSATFKRIYSQRTAVERVINVLKLDLNGGRLAKRHNVNFQARLDKSILAVHMLIKTDPGE